MGACVAMMLLVTSYPYDVENKNNRVIASINASKLEIIIRHTNNEKIVRYIGSIRVVLAVYTRLLHQEHQGSSRITWKIVERPHLDTKYV